MPEYEAARMSQRGNSNVKTIMPKIGAAVSERSQGTKIDLASAENWLLRDELLDICKDAITSDLSAQDFSYPRSFSGFPGVLTAFAGFLNEYFNPAVPVDISHISTAPGAASCLDALLFNICDPGDGILVPGPYWGTLPAVPYRRLTLTLIRRTGFPIQSQVFRCAGAGCDR
jgi:aspartate/methionine/tyrosine aminotransferase